MIRVILDRPQEKCKWETKINIPKAKWEPKRQIRLKNKWTQWELYSLKHNEENMKSSRVYTQWEQRRKIKLRQKIGVWECILTAMACLCAQSERGKSPLSGWRCSGIRAGNPSHSLYLQTQKNYQVYYVNVSVSNSHWFKYIRIQGVKPMWILDGPNNQALP